MESLFLFFIFLVALSCFFWTLLKFDRVGINCFCTFSLAWFFAYSLPILYFLFSENDLIPDIFFREMDSLTWIFSSLIACAGYALFCLGYYFVLRRLSVKRKLFVSDSVSSSWGESFFIWVCCLLQVYAILFLLRSGVSVNFEHRQEYWNQINELYYLFYFSIPASILSLRSALKRRGKLAWCAFWVVFVISATSSVLAGLRMVLVINIVALFLTYIIYKDVKRVLLISCLCFVLIISFSGVFRYYFRSKNDVRGSVSGTFLDDLSRIQILSYIDKHAGFTRSEIVDPPGVSSYLYWLILAVPRNVWPDKPFAAVLQFNAHVGNLFQIRYLNKPLYELFSGYQFGFLDEGVMNFGFLGIFIMFFWGGVAAWLDTSNVNVLISKIGMPIFYFVGVSYAFHTCLLLLFPMLIVLFAVDRFRFFRWRLILKFK